MLELEGFARLYHTGESAVLAGDNNFTGLDGKRTPTMRAIDLLYYIAQAQSFQRGCVSSHFSFKSFSSVGDRLVAQVLEERYLRGPHLVARV